MPGMEYPNRGSKCSPAETSLIAQCWRVRALLVLMLVGCATTPRGIVTSEAPTIESHSLGSEDESDRCAIVQASLPTTSDSVEKVDATVQLATLTQEASPASVPLLASTSLSIDTLPSLEAVAVNRNPELRRLAQQYEAARAKVSYVDGLPDPTIGANIFAAPIETAAGSQQANFTIGQMIPWLDRLDAQAQQACFEAMASQQIYAAQKLKVIGDLRAMWCRLYVLGKQIQINEANQDLLESLIQVAAARVETGKATQGDVLAGTLEYSKLEEQLITLRQQERSVFAEMNRVMGRDSEIFITPPNDLQVSLPQWDHPMLRQMAIEYQPDIQAARIRTQATRWGLEVARLKRRPDFSVNASWFAIDDNRPASNLVDVGDDAWSVGASVSIPLWDRKYDALEREARWKHSASHASVEETLRKNDSVLRDLWEQARAADETAGLYRETILPQAQATLEADQQSYVNGTVDFDRVIRDVRNVLTLEIGYHRAVGQLGATLARIEQSVGTALAR